MKGWKGRAAAAGFGTLCLKEGADWVCEVRADNLAENGKEKARKDLLGLYGLSEKSYAVFMRQSKAAAIVIPRSGTR